MTVLIFCFLFWQFRKLESSTDHTSRYCLLVFFDWVQLSDKKCNHKIKKKCLKNYDDIPNAWSICGFIFSTCITSMNLLCSTKILCSLIHSICKILRVMGIVKTMGRVSYYFFAAFVIIRDYAINYFLSSSKQKAQELVYHGEKYWVLL
mgnify:CR=1 FL=1